MFLLCKNVKIVPRECSVGPKSAKIRFLRQSRTKYMAKMLNISKKTNTTSERKPLLTKSKSFGLVFRTWLRLKTYVKFDFLTFQYFSSTENHFLDLNTKLCIPRRPKSVETCFFYVKMLNSSTNLELFIFL